MSAPASTVSAEYMLLYRIAQTLEQQTAALERIAAAAEAQAQQEPVSFPNAPVLQKDRPRAGGRGRS